jgi:hypothetical protein
MMSQPYAGAVATGPFVGFQQATIQTLERSGSEALGARLRVT